MFTCFHGPLRYFSRLRLVIILTRVCFGSDSSPCQEIHFGNREYFERRSEIIGNFSIGITWTVRRMERNRGRIFKDQNLCRTHLKQKYLW